MEETQSIFEELCMPHLDGAYNFARLLVGRDEDAQDVVQEAYVLALKRFPGYRGNDARMWLLAIVQQAAYKWLKKHTKQSYMVRFDPAIPATTTDQPLSESSREEQAQQPDQTLNRLPVELRAVLFLREIEGWSYKNLASALNVPPDKVMSQLSQARQRLRQELVRVHQQDLKHEL